MAEKSPDAYRTISEAGEETGLPAHVLRFWESRFTQLKPVKRAGGRRLYRPQDILLLKGLKTLLYEEGFTIKGAQKYLKDHGVADVCAIGEGASPGAPHAASSAPPVSADDASSEADDGPGLFEVPSADRAHSNPVAAPPAPGAVDQLIARLESSKARLDSALEAHRAAV